MNGLRERAFATANVRASSVIVEALETACDKNDRWFFYRRLSLALRRIDKLGQRLSLSILISENQA
jgi:hypothetical protein